MEWGTLALLTFSVLAFAGVLYWTRYVIVFAAAALAALWCLRVLAGASLHAIGCGRVPAVGVGVIAGFLVLPLVPLPAALVRLVAPHAFALYSQALPGWPDRPAFAALDAHVDLGVWRPLALVPYDTVTTLWSAAAYATVGALVAFYPWRHRGESVLRRLSLMLIAVASFEAVYGMLQQSYPTPSILGAACPTGVCLGTYVNPDHYAGLLEMVVPLALVRAVSWVWVYRLRHVPPARTTNWRLRLAHYLDALYDPAIGRAVSFGCIALLLCVAMAISGCRSALAATALSILLMLPLLPWRQRHPARLQVTALALVVVAAGFWATFPRLSQKFATRDLQSEVQLTGTRALIAADTFGMVRDFPVLGVGLGNFASVFPAYRARTVRFSMDIEHAHNDYLEWLAEVGGPAAAVTFALLLWLGARVIRALRRTGDVTPNAVARWGCATGALALLFHSFTDFNLHVPANALVFSVLLGALLRLTSPVAERRASQALPIAACILIVVMLASTWQRWNVAEAMDRAQLDGLLNAAERAPDAPRLQDALGQQLLAINGTPDSRAAASRAFIGSLWAAPLNPRALLHLASTVDPSGAAVDLVTRAAALAPYDPATQLDIADWYLARWATFDPPTRAHAGQEIQAVLKATARAPYVVQRRYDTLNAYDRVQGVDHS